MPEEGVWEVEVEVEVEEEEEWKSSKRGRTGTKIELALRAARSSAWPVCSGKTVLRKYRTTFSTKYTILIPGDYAEKIN